MPSLCSDLPRHTDLHLGRKILIAYTEQLADAIFAEEPDRPGEAPREALRLLQAEGLFAAPLPSSYGGLGLGTEPGGHGPLLRVLATVGGADLALGRLYEGHVNALLLVHAYGTPQQMEVVAEEARSGYLFGVWNTGAGTPMRLHRRDGRLMMEGCKAFATGAGFVDRPIVTVEFGGWQMTLPRMESSGVADNLRVDRDSWQPFGMESSESFTVDFQGAVLEPGDLLGDAEDFYREPLFRGGAIRFAAVQTGALLRLTSEFARWLTARGRGSDPYQLARLGEIELRAQEAALWVERAATIAEDCLWAGGVDSAASQRMIRCANMTRLAVERAATALMTDLVRGVGAHGLVRPARFERMLRDLTMYLRQPNPDSTLADVGRTTLSQESAGYWSDATACKVEETSLAG